jgi:hypothetical protein
MVAASHPSSWRHGRAFVAVGHEISERARIEDDMETAVNLQLLHLISLHDPLTTGAPGVTLLSAVAALV